MDIVEYKDYRKLIQDWIQKSSDRGSRTRMAAAAQCSPSWITRVLNGAVQLTPDQAFAIAQYLHLNELETDYFVFLVELERAATPALRKRIEGKLSQLQTEGKALRSSIRTDSDVSEKDRVRYYSSWIYPAVHVFCMIRPQTIEDICARLKLSPNVVKGAITDLRAMGLISNHSGKLSATSKSIHLPSTHPMANIAHGNWRQRTLQHLQEGGNNGFFYSAVHCLSKRDFELVQKKLKDAILSCRKTIEKSPSETLSILNLDWYEF